MPKVFTYNSMIDLQVDFLDIKVMNSQFRIRYDCAIDILSHPYFLYHINQGQYLGNMAWNLKPLRTSYTFNFSYLPFLVVKKIDNYETHTITFNEKEYYGIFQLLPALSLSVLQHTYGLDVHILRGVQIIFSSTSFIFEHLFASSHILKEKNEKQNLFSQFITPMFVSVHSGPFGFFHFLARHNMLPITKAYMNNICLYFKEKQFEDYLHQVTKLFLKEWFCLTKKYNNFRQGFSSNIFYAQSNDLFKYIDCTKTNNRIEIDISSY
jgi:hypothetical protein